MTKGKEPERATCPFSYSGDGANRYCTTSCELRREGYCEFRRALAAQSNIALALADIVYYLQCLVPSLSRANGARSAGAGNSGPEAAPANPIPAERQAAMNRYCEGLRKLEQEAMSAANTARVAHDT